MKPYQWITALVLGIIIHIVDVVLTIQLLSFESNVVEFFEGNHILAPLFINEFYPTVFVIKCLGWFIVMALALHHRIQKWVTPTVIWSTLVGFGVIVAWNFSWLVHVTYF